MSTTFAFDVVSCVLSFVVLVLLDWIACQRNCSKDNLFPAGAGAPKMFGGAGLGAPNPEELAGSGAGAGVSEELDDTAAGAGGSTELDEAGAGAGAPKKSDIGLCDLINRS